jgi:hypothetical protein
MQKTSFPLLRFLMRHMRPYRWHYLIMMMAPLVTGFFPFAWNYAIKMLLDIMEQGGDMSYGAVLTPLLLFIGA